MNCPKCYEPLRIAERQGVEIDYCPDCRGIWLDRGELDKIIERTVQDDFDRPSSGGYRKEHRPDEGRYYKKQKRYKKKHILKEIIDLFD